MTPKSFTSCIIICPAHTIVSLLARAISLPDFIAAMVGSIPLIPTTALSTISASGMEAAVISPFFPKPVSKLLFLSSFFNSRLNFSSATDTNLGLNSSICFFKRVILLPAASATTSISLLYLIISRACVPIEPVEPSMLIFLIIYSLYS